MERWERELDKYLTTPPEDPPSIKHCANCDGDLFVDGEYMYDLVENEWYCDSDCYIDKMCDNITSKTLEAPECDER